MNTIKINCKGSGTMPLDKLKALQGNLKALSKVNYDKIRKVILDHGFCAPVFIWKDRILDGHQRIRVLKEMRDKEGYKIPSIPVCHIEAKNEKQARKILLGLASQYGSLDNDGLFEFLTESEIKLDELVDNFNFPEVDFPKFAEEFFDLSQGKEGLTEDDAIPEKVEPKVKRGDIWVLGNHRLMCGDSTNISDVEKLMNGEKADMIFTDPPYGLGDKKSFNKNHKDYADDVAFDLTKLAFNSDFVIWGANYYDYLPQPRSEIGWIVWDKRPTRDTWDKDTRDAADRIFGQHFEIAVTNVSGMRGKMIRKTWGGFYGTAGNPEDTIVHKTQKPIELLSHFIQDNHKIILDYFGGSGSTLIACEKTNRKCFMMEIDPQYCDVIITRWEQFTGLKAKKN